MTEFLVRRFVKKPAETQDAQVRRAYGSLGSGVGVAFNGLLALGKLALGLGSGSLAILADAANNLSDALGSIVALVSMRLAAKPMDRAHPFGHGRMEYIGALAVGALILAMGSELLKAGIKAIAKPLPPAVSLGTLLLLLAAVVVKLWLFFFYRKLGRRISSAPLLAAAKDSLADVLATGAVLVSVGLQYALGWQVDGYVGVLVALVVLRAGYGVCKDTVNRLLGNPPDPEKTKQLRDRLLSYPGILGVHDLALHDYGPGRCIASVHAEVSDQSNIVAVHEVVDQAEREIGQALHMELCIHVDPIVSHDPQVNAVKAQMESFLREIDPRATLHDFRMVAGDQQVRLVFDCAVPEGFPDRAGLLRAMKAYAKSLDGRYELIVQFDLDPLAR